MKWVAGCHWDRLIYFCVIAQLMKGKLAGKKIAVFDYDKSQSQLVHGVGAQVDSLIFSNFAAKFNNGG